MKQSSLSQGPHRQWRIMLAAALLLCHSTGAKEESEEKACQKDQDEGNQQELHLSPLFGIAEFETLVLVGQNIEKCDSYIGERSVVDINEGENKGVDTSLPRWHGTKTEEYEKQDPWEILGRAIFIEEHFERVEYPLPSMFSSTASSMRTRTRRICLIKYDPSESPQHEGHCLYAALKMGLNGACNLKGIYFIRGVIEKAWKDSSQSSLLSTLAGREGLDPESYLDQYVRQGWGGLPEIFQYMRKTKIGVRVWLANGTMAANIVDINCTAIIDLLYHAEHYQLLASGKVEKYWLGNAKHMVRPHACRGGGDRRSRLRSRSPRIILISREERLAKERREERRRREDEERKAERARADKEEKRQRYGTCEEELTGGQELRKEKMKREDEGERKNPTASSSRRGRASCEAPTRDAPPPPPDSEVKAETQDKEKRKKEGKAKKEKEQTAESSAQRKEGGKENRKSAADEDKERPDPSIIQLYELKVAEGRICILCGKWLDRPHENSVRHRKNVAYVLELDSVNQGLYRRSCTTWVEENMLKREGAKRKNQGAEPAEESAEKEQKVEEDEEEESWEVLSEAVVEAAKSEPHTEDEDTIASTLNALLPPALSASDNEHDGDDNNDSMLAADDDDAATPDEDARHDNDGLPPTESCESDLEPLEAISGLMVVHAGNRKIGLRICHHTSSYDIIATIALEMRLMVRQTALVRGNDMFVFNSGNMQPAHACGVWKAWKLPLAMEHRPEPPRQADEELDRVEDKRCEHCIRGMVHVQEEEQNEHHLSNEAELELMQGEDHNVALLILERPRDTITWQVYQSSTIGQFLDEYAAVKRVKRSALMVFNELPDDQIIQSDMHMALMKRGAGKRHQQLHDNLLFLVRDYVQMQCYFIEFEGKVQELMRYLGKEYETIVYKGARLSAMIEMDKLKGRELFCFGPLLPSLPELRPWTGVATISIMNLVEISEYMLDVDLDMEGQNHRDQLEDVIAKISILRGGVMTRQQWQKQQHLLRGGTGRGKLAWESTQCIKGVRAVTEFKVGGAKVEQISSDMVCSGAGGISFALMANWPRLAEVTSTKPLLLIFPGRCTAALQKLQVPADRISEDEIVLQDADATTMTRRRVTMLRMSEHHWDIGSNFRSITWAPHAAIEIVIEMDSRWMVDTTIAEAKRDWRNLANTCASKLALTSFKQTDIYGAKLLHDQPFYLWQARMRQPSEMVEKLMIASGREGCFVRASNPKEVAEHQSFTIVWTQKNMDASAATLASILLKTESLAGHRGLARSMASVGVRVPWKIVKEARATLTPEDHRFNDETRGMHNGLHFKLEGVPIGADSQEVARFCREILWPAVPHRRGGHQSWSNMVGQRGIAAQGMVCHMVKGTRAHQSSL